MIIPSIDIESGQAVQLIGGREKAIDGGEPRAWLERFKRVGEMAVVDLDAALGRGSNREQIEQLCRQARCRVGGGIRDIESARRWLDAGAVSIVIGTAAEPELLKQLPKERVIVALDAIDGDVVVEGWRRKTGRGIVERMAELRDYCGGFLVTFVEREGRLAGTNMDAVAQLVLAAGNARVTIAGGVSTPEEVAELDRLGADAQVGMALYKGSMDLTEAFAAPLRSDRPDGLWATVVCDERGNALGLAWSNMESLNLALTTGRGVYHSRSRGLWRKGESSGATQQLLRVEVDCDRDALRFIVRQEGTGFCHKDTYDCWGAAHGLTHLERTLQSRYEAAPAGSYSRRLFDEPDLLNSKLREEAAELAQARTREEVIWEAADLFYFAQVAMTRAGVSLSAVEAELDRRSLKLERRGGERKQESAS